jgi:hypothetical protein
LLGLADRSIEGQTPDEAKPIPEAFIPRFDRVCLPPHRSWRTFAASLVMHSIFIPAMPAIFHLIPDSAEEVWTKRAFVVKPLEFQVPDRIYLPAPPPKVRRAPPSRSGPQALKPAAAPAKPARAKTETAKAPRQRTPVRKFELPAMAKRTGSDQTILQPQYPPDLPLQEQVRLPNVMFWSSQAPKLPRPAAKKFIEPGRHAAEPPPQSVLDSTPRLELPNQELMVADLKVAGGVFKDQPVLPRPRATTMPIRTFTAPVPQAPREVIIDSDTGDAANLLALSPNPAPPTRSLVVPAGNQLGAMPEPPEDAAGASVSAQAESAGGNAGAGAAAGVHTGHASGLGSSSGGVLGGTGTGSAGAGKGGAGGRSGPSGGTGTGGGELRAGAAGPGGFGVSTSGVPGGQGLSVSPATQALGAAAAVPIRIVHPVTAVYDVVVQSSASGVLPDTEGLLSGKPVYTVYVQAGTDREWILQFCRPAATEYNIKQAGSVVSLNAPAPIKPPYPLVTFTPPVTLLARSNYLIVHGLIDATGHFRTLKLLRETDPRLREQIIPVLEKWEFRPGTRDGMPVLLEILLVIPPNREG